MGLAILKIRGHTGMPLTVSLFAYQAPVKNLSSESLLEWITLVRLFFISMTNLSPFMQAMFLCEFNHESVFGI
jgi:hypothetical protein